MRYRHRQRWSCRASGGYRSNPRPLVVYVNGGMMRYRTRAGAEACAAAHGGKVGMAW